MLDETAVNYRVVLTKCDKQKNEQLAQRKQNIEEALKKHAAAQPMIAQTSAWKKFGLDELHVQIMDLI